MATAQHTPISRICTGLTINFTIIDLMTLFVSIQSYYSSTNKSLVPCLSEKCCVLYKHGQESIAVSFSAASLIVKSIGGSKWPWNTAGTRTSFFHTILPGSHRSSAEQPTTVTEIVCQWSEIKLTNHGPTINIKWYGLFSVNEVIMQKWVNHQILPDLYCGLT